MHQGFCDDQGTVSAKRGECAQSMTPVMRSSRRQKWKLRASGVYYQAQCAKTIKETKGPSREKAGKMREIFSSGRESQSKKNARGQSKRK